MVKIDASPLTYHLSMMVGVPGGPQERKKKTKCRVTPILKKIHSIMLACTHFRSNGGFRQVKITVAHYKKKQSFTSIRMRMSVYVYVEIGSIHTYKSFMYVDDQWTLQY